MNTLARRDEPPPKDWEDEYRRLKETHIELQIISNVRRIESHLQID